jgi:hypothetical protein
VKSKSNVCLNNFSLPFIHGFGLNVIGLNMFDLSNNFD